MPAETDRLLYTVDLAGTLFFGIEGAMAAIGGNLDLLGLLVLACATAFGGGIIRDLLIGDIPPASLRDWRYVAVAVAGGASAFFLHSQVQETPAWLLTVVDAAGLALFAVAGTEKALQFKMHPFIAALMGMITGVGGGVVRDVLLAQVPRILRADVYATAALAGAVIMLAARKLPFSDVGRDTGWNSVFSLAHDQCLEALEFAKGPRGLSCTPQIDERASVSTETTWERRRLLCLRRCTQCRPDHRK